MRSTLQRRTIVLPVFALFATGVAALAAAPATRPATVPAKAAAPAKPNPLAPVADDSALPRVLLIGDSISIGYTLPVRERLKGKANVHRPPTNCAATIHGLKQIDAWLGDPATPGGKWDVIHFNWGLHDLKYHDGKGTITPVGEGTQQVPVDEYERNLRTLVKRLKQTNATLIWRTTTPVPEGAKGRVPGDEVKYNAAAERVMGEEGVAIHDLYAFAKPRLAEIGLKADVHYSARGYAALADDVARAIGEALDRRAGDKDGEK